MENSLINKDLWKKPCYHIETDRKCRGTRGLAGLPQATAEGAEEYFSSWGRGEWVSLRSVVSKPQGGSPAWSTRTRKGAHITTGNETQWRFCPPRRQLETQTPF